VDFIWKIAFFRGDFKIALVNIGKVIELCNKIREKNLLYTTRASRLWSHILQKIKRSQKKRFSAEENGMRIYH
jgi:hypothetical protein